MFLSLVRVRGFAPKACVLVCASTSSFFSFGFATLAVARGHAASARALCPAGEGSWTTPRTWLSTGPLASSTLSISSSSGAPVGTGAGCSTLGRTSGFGTLQEGAGDFAVPLGANDPAVARPMYPFRPRFPQCCPVRRISLSQLAVCRCARAWRVSVLLLWHGRLHHPFHPIFLFLLSPLFCLFPAWRGYSCLCVCVWQVWLGGRGAR